MEIDDVCARARAMVPWKQVVFMLMCCERMLPNYRAFYRQSKFGSPSVLEHALVTAWDWAMNGTYGENVQEIRMQVEAQAPDTEDHLSLLTSAALDTANCIATVLDAIEEFDSEHTQAVVELARDTVDMWVREKDKIDPRDPHREIRVRSHPLMSRELYEMWRSLNLLDDQRSRDVLVEELRKQNSLLSVGSIW